MSIHGHSCSSSALYACWASAQSFLSLSAGGVGNHPPNSARQFPGAPSSLESPSFRSFNHCPLSTLFGETKPDPSPEPSPRMDRVSPLLTAPSRRLESHSTCHGARGARRLRSRGDPPDQWCLEEGPRTGRPRRDHNRLGHTMLWLYRPGTDTGPPRVGKPWPRMVCTLGRPMATVSR